MEFALVAPLLLLLAFGILGYGYMLSFRQALSQGAAEGARAAAVSAYPLAADKEAAALKAINDALGNSAYGVTCSGTAPGSVLRRNNVTVGTCSVRTAPCVNDLTRSCVTAKVDYLYADHPLLPKAPGLGLVLPEHLAYEATVRVS